MRINLLTKREHEIFKLLNTGITSNDISLILNISEKTVRNHISNVMQKLGCKTRKEAIEILIKSDLL